LNDKADYEGGGLRTVSNGDVVNGDAGTMIVLAGEVAHSEEAVVSGTRWVLTAQLYIEKNIQSNREAGYTLREIERAC